jgi:subtilisin family serine protease
VLALLTAPAGAQDAPKKPIASASDLPRFTYPVEGTASALLTVDAATFDTFGAKVRADVERVLATYDIQDRGTLRDLLTEKLDLQLMAGNEDAAALQTAAQIRALEEKPDGKLLSGLLTTALVTARAQSGASSGDAFNAAFQKNYAAALATLPWAVVGSTLKETKTGFDVITPAFRSGQIGGILDPTVAKTHELSGDSAAMIVRNRYFLVDLLPAKAGASAALGAVIAKNSVVKPDIWPARDVTLSAHDKLTPVRVAIWDSGSDVAVYRKQLYTDPHPGAFDPHGLAFDLQNYKTHGTLLPTTKEQRARFPAAVAFLEGYSDLSDGIDSPAATLVKKQMTTMSQADVAAFAENLEFAGLYSHGTHVAGIALRGNPAARLVVARLTFDYKNVPTPPTQAGERRAAANMMTYVKYFRDHNVRVVNMSWGGSPTDIEASLEKNSIGNDATERKAMAANLFAIDRAGLLAALESAPEILFVCSAGNSNGNTDFNDTIPASFDLPNLIAVGAVDQAGDETSFTSYGKSVTIDADGYHVESYVPGGTRVRMSGTSMASPNVVNLAAKLLALDPKLTPVQTIALIRKGASTTRDGRRHLIDEKASIALLRRQLTARR